MVTERNFLVNIDFVFQKSVYVILHLTTSGVIFNALDPAYFSLELRILCLHQQKKTRETEGEKKEKSEGGGGLYGVAAIISLNSASLSFCTRLLTHHGRIWNY